jgi:hypothetical protein
MTAMKFPKELEEFIYEQEQQEFIESNKLAYALSNQDAQREAMEVEIRHLREDNARLQQYGESLQFENAMVNTRFNSILPEHSFLKTRANELEQQLAHMKALLTESHERERELREQFDQPARNGPDADPRFNNTQEVHAYLVTPKTLDRSKDIRNCDMSISEVYQRCVPQQGTTPELSSFVTTQPHWKLATAEGARVFGTGTANDYIARKIAQNIKPGYEDMYQCENWKVAPENGEHINNFQNLRSGYAFPFNLTQGFKRTVDFSKSIWDQVMEALDNGMREELIIKMDENGRRMFDRLVKIQYLRNL